MDPARTLRRLCRRHGLPLERARRLLPLIQRAARASVAVRGNLLAAVEASMAREAAELAQSERLERRCLIAVASALHAWPPA